jgi:hypothetical protein
MNFLKHHISDRLNWVLWAICATFLVVGVSSLQTDVVISKVTIPFSLGLVALNTVVSYITFRKKQK